MNLQRFFLVFLTTALSVASFGVTPAEAARHKRHTVHPAVDRFAEIVIDANTGYVFSEKNADKRLYPASLSKMMTLYLTFDALEHGMISKNQRIYVSKRASMQEPSSLGLAEGETIRIEDCILAIATKSANDCAVALGEAVGGSEPRFGALMTAKARQLGMRNTNFVNASGLFNPMQYSSARDMAILAQALIRDHARFYRYFSTASFTYNGETYLNHNKLMSYYRGMDGLKTGYVYASGYNLAASAVRNGTRVIGVIFGGRTARSRNNAMAELLDQAFVNARDPARIAALRTQQVQLPATVKPASRPPLVEVSDTVADNSPPFNSLGLVVDQGDTDIGNDDAGRAKDTPRPVALFQPQLINTAPLAAQKSGEWAIQIGAFSSHDAGEKALQFAKSSLSGVVTGAVDSIAPLMTPRGMVYRARLSGLGRDSAAAACRILKGNCLVLAVE